MKINKTNTLLLGAVAISLMSWQPANAGFHQGDAVTLGGQPILQMAAAGGLTGSHRAWQTQDALDNALVLAADRSPSALTISRENGAVVLLLDGQRIATVDSGSAEKANLTVDQMADEWAQSIKNFLSDTDRTAAYVATLTNENPVQASLALVERTMYAPSMMTLPIKLSTLIVSATAAQGDAVEAILDKDVPMGNYVIPSGSVVLGQIVEKENDNFTLHFTSLRSTNGTLYPINATVVDRFIVETTSPHSVCTYAIPSGMANDAPLVSGRIPATIGIGTEDASTSRLLVFHRTTENLVIGRPLILELGNVTQVAVVMRNTM